MKKIKSKTQKIKNPTQTTIFLLITLLAITSFSLVFYSQMKEVRLIEANNFNLGKYGNIKSLEEIKNYKRKNTSLNESETVENHKEKQEKDENKLTNLKIKNNYNKNEWQLYKNEKYGFKFEFKKEWGNPEVLIKKDIVVVNYGPICTNMKKEICPFSKMIVYLDKNIPKYYNIGEECISKKEEICIMSSPIKEKQYVLGDFIEGKYQKFLINDKSAYLSGWGGSIERVEVFIKGVKNGYLFSTSEFDNDDFRNLLLSFSAK